jgi:hypothetical protein
MPFLPEQIRQAARNGAPPKNMQVSATSAVTFQRLLGTVYSDRDFEPTSAAVELRGSGSRPQPPALPDVG